MRASEEESRENSEEKFRRNFRGGIHRSNQEEDFWINQQNVYVCIQSQTRFCETILIHCEVTPALVNARKSRGVLEGNIDRKYSTYCKVHNCVKQVRILQFTLCKDETNVLPLGIVQKVIANDRPYHTGCSSRQFGVQSKVSYRY